MNILLITLNYMLSIILAVNTAVWCDLISYRGYEGAMGNWELALAALVLVLILFILPEIARLCMDDYYETFERKPKCYTLFGIVALVLDVSIHTHFGFEYYNMLAVYTLLLYILKCIKWQYGEYNKFERLLYGRVSDFLFNNKKNSHIK